MTKILTGKVVSTGKIPGTVTVLVETLRPHPLYRKIIKRTKKYLVSGANVKQGDKVVIFETKPVSKLKHFRIEEKK